MATAQTAVLNDPLSEFGQEMKEVNTSGKKPFSTDEEDDAHASSAATTSTRKSTRSKRSHKEEKLEKPTWVPDDQATKCHKCETAFSLFHRKHHCRGCGNIFCIKCCDHWLLPPKELEYTTIQRTCQSCFKRLSSLNFERNYDEWGRKDDPAIVLVHGACGTRKNWFLLGPALAEKGYHVIAPDMPEHGARYEEKLYMNSAIEAVADMIHYYVPSKKALVFGYSMGGYIAMAFGAKYPELCRGLIIGGAGTDMRKDRSMLEWMGTYYKLLSNKSKTSLEKTWHDTPLISAKVEEDVLNEYCLRAGSYYEAWPSIVNMLTSENYKKVLMQVKAPVLFFTGQHDRRDAERKWLNATTNARLEVIPDAGYMCVIDKRHRDKVRDLILQFAGYAFSLSKDKRQDKRRTQAPRVPKAATDKGKEKEEKDASSSATTSTNKEEQKVEEQKKAGESKKEKALEEEPQPETKDENTEEEKP
jgi:pimeloyl-ACP methyl ester carboxylesterase